MLSLLTALVFSQAPVGEGWRLSWTAPAQCTQAEAMRVAIERKLGRPLFSEPARRVIVGAVTQSEDGWRATITLADVSGVVLGTREVSAREPACTALDARVLFIVGLLIQPSKDSGPIISQPAPLPTLPIEPPPNALLAREREVIVHLESSSAAVRLIEVVDEGRGARGSWVGTTERCGVPCDRPLRSEGRYYLGGDDVVPATIDLKGVLGTSVTLRIEVGSLTRRTWGVIGLSLGVSSALAGLLSLALGSVSPALVAAGAALLPLGGVSIGVGIWAVASSKTVVTAEPALR